MLYSVNIDGPGRHTHTRAGRRGCPGGFGALNSSPLEYFLSCLCGFQSSLLLIYFHKGPNGCSHCTKVWHKTCPIYDARLSTDERGAASLRHRNHAEITFFVCEQKPCAVRFSWQCKSYPVSVAGPGEEPEGPPA